MKAIHKLTSLAVVLAMSMSMAACGGSSSSSSAPSATPSSTAPASGGDAAPAADVGGDIGEHSWTLGMDSPKDTVTYAYGQKFADEINSLSGGKMMVDIYTDGTLGGDLALLESCQGGNVTFVVQNTAPQVNFIPELAVFDLPMAYPTIGEFRQIFSNEEFMGKISGFYEAAGYKLLGYSDQTFRVMSSNKKIESMDDFKGVKIRTMENPNHMDFWKTLGAAPTPMAFGELYTGLQQGTVVAQENPYAVIVANKFYEVQDYVVQTNHLPHILSLIMDPVAYSNLNDAEKAIVDQATANAIAYANEEADAMEATKIEEIKSNGTEIIPVTPELYEAMKAAAQPVYESIAGKVGQELVDAYLGQ